MQEELSAQDRAEASEAYAGQRDAATEGESKAAVTLARSRPGTGTGVQQDQDSQRDQWVREHERQQKEAGIWIAKGIR